MKELTWLITCALAAVSMVQEPRSLQADRPITCAACDTWNAKREPFRLFGNTYYVGVAGLSSILIVSEKGHVLIDGDLPQSASVIDEHIRSLGFRLQDVRLILTSHEHYDHVGGVAALQRASGAVVASSPDAARALRQGGPLPDDPQYGFGREFTAFPAVRDVRAVTDGEILRVSDLAVTAYLTPGHTPGSTTWAWRSCEGSRCMNVVYADSLNPVSAPGFKFSERRGRVDAFRQSIATVRNLPCDILVSVHPEFSNIDKKLQLRAEGADPDPFIDATSCRAYAETASQSLERRISEER